MQFAVTQAPAFNNMVRLTGSSSSSSRAPSWGQPLPPPGLPTKRTYSDSDIDAYAQRVLESMSSQSPDSSLGSYITSLLRCSDEMSNHDVREVADFDSLLELVQEHCACSTQDATESLQLIATAVRTNELPAGSSNATTASSQYPPLEPSRGDASSIYKNDNKTGPSRIETEFPTLSASMAQTSLTPNEKKNFASPLHANNLIPVDLMGALDDPSTPKKGKGLAHPPTTTSQAPKPVVDESAFPPLNSAAAKASKKTKPPVAAKPRGKSGAHSKPQPAEDLAAALFVTPRSRQPSIDETGTQQSASSSPSLQGVAAPLDVTAAIPTTYLEEQQYASTIEMLLSMNAELGEEAAAMATSFAGADVNVAQYLVDSVFSAPPMCRNVLSGAGCYRSDCTFSHDIDTYTCAFWLRGRCGKGQSCRFLHGFNPRLLEGLHNTNNDRNEYAPAHQEGNFPSLAGAAASTGGQPLRTNTWSTERQGTKGSNSFANIASQGGGTVSFTDHSSNSWSAQPQTYSKPKKVDIPIEVWSAHENRDASVFYISDPIERHNAVAKTVRRKDVVDLHFQSTKTFGVVLSHLLPTKLAENEGGVWVVTGTGHHVGSKTHQKGGGALESAVMNWLYEEGYEFAKGRDRNGQSGALLVYNN
mmetsp:Transcript_1803/g.3653  ORF Transcript_1803/g.3653 Transcript_1803/m.3653 type:complete len:644 (+) Transcript_1803:227-2158(+)